MMVSVSEALEKSENTPTVCPELSIENGTTLINVKGKGQYWKRPNFKNEMEALITNHVKEYVLTNT